MGYLFRRFISRTGMSADIGIPPGFASIGITDAVIPVMIGDALKDLSAKSNPRKADAKDFEMMIG